MFNEQFYPTPKEVCHKMISKAKQGRKFLFPLLEPSAGKGDILDSLCDTFRGRNPKKEMFAIEIEPELRMVLQGKNYRVIGTDFLEYNEPCEFGTILMNPPFSSGAKHTLHAWQFLKDGGVLVGLVNSETINNPHTKERQNLASLIREYGYTEELGDCFSQSERKTGVNVSLIVLEKPEKEETFDFSGFNFQQDSIDCNIEDPTMLAHSDAIKDLVSRYNAAVNVLKERQRNQKYLDAVLQGIETPLYGSPEYQKGDALKQKSDFNDQLLTLKSCFWSTIFNKTRIQEFATSQIREKFYQFAQKQTSLAFTEENVKSLLEMFFLNRKEIMYQCLCDTFDKATRYHEKNIIHHEGWKTNKASKLNKKIILPFAVEYSDGRFSVYRSHIRVFLSDMDKCLTYLSGKTLNQDESTYDKLRDACYRANQEGYQQKFNSEFFWIRIFKKGTMHLEFKDEKLLEDFNLKVAEGRKWIGSNY